MNELGAVPVLAKLDETDSVSYAANSLQYGDVAVAAALCDSIEQN